MVGLIPRPVSATVHDLLRRHIGGRPAAHGPLWAARGLSYLASTEIDWNPVEGHEA